MEATALTIYSIEQDLAAKSFTDVNSLEYKKAYFIKKIPS